MGLIEYSSVAHTRPRLVKKIRGDLLEIIRMGRIEDEPRHIREILREQYKVLKSKTGSKV